MQNWPNGPKYIGCQKLAFMTQIDLSVDRPVYRLTVIFQTVGVVSRPLGRPHPGQCPLVDRSVDSGQNQRAMLFGRSTGARSREQPLWIDRPSGRPALKPRACTRSVHIGRPLGRLIPGSVNRLVDRQKHKIRVLRFEN